MKPEQIIEALEAACTQLGVVVKYENMTGETSGAAGLCKVKGQWRVLIDKKLNVSDRTAVLVDALSRFDTENIYLPPQVREAVQARRGGGIPPAPAKTEEAPATEQASASAEAAAIEAPAPVSAEAAATEAPAPASDPKPDAA